MLIIPAIDLRGGRVVRLTRGDFNQEKNLLTRTCASCHEVATKWGALNPRG